MANNDQVEIDGELITYGECEDPGYEGLCFVSIGTSYDHTTFIVDPWEADIQAIHTRGADRQAWGLVAIAITSGYWL